MLFGSMMVRDSREWGWNFFQDPMWDKMYKLHSELLPSLLHLASVKNFHFAHRTEQRTIKKLCTHIEILTQIFEDKVTGMCLYIYRVLSYILNQITNKWYVIKTSTTNSNMKFLISCKIHDWDFDQDSACHDQHDLTDSFGSKYYCYCTLVLSS